MSVHLLLRPAAVADLSDAYAWYEKRLVGLGAEFMDAVEQKLAQIEVNPQQFPEVRGTTRRAIVRRFPYSVLYVLRGARIFVSAIMHHAREPLRWQRRD